MGKEMTVDFGAPTHNQPWTSPRHFLLGNESDKAELTRLIEAGEVVTVHNHVDLAVGELFDIKYPHLKDSKSDEQVEAFKQEIAPDPEKYGEWVYYPWSKEVIHFPSKDDLRALRTSRNRNLVTAEEQLKLYDATIVVVGLSVGSNVVEALVSQGIAGKLIIVDMDILEPSNLNRIRAPYNAIGDHKVDYVAKKVSYTDPYIEQFHYHDGLNEQNLEEIIQTHKPDILIDEMDNVAMKLRLRAAAKTAQIPVIMAADDGDNILLDIERYDQKPDLAPLHGNIPQEVIDMILAPGQDLPRAQLGMIIGKYFVGLENTPLRMFESLGEVGKTLPSWPQLGGAAALAGTTLAYCTKRILLDQPINDGRFVVGPDEQLNPEIHTLEYKQRLETFIQMISQAAGA